ncbi:MAG: hypothetical protein FWG11_01440 [Promicromonosporaceae bacterium]|nr:hypothetical protein [Promicromonosporaceae bacterium]
MLIDVQRIQQIRSLSHELSTKHLRDVNLLFDAVKVPPIESSEWEQDDHWREPTDRITVVQERVQGLQTATLLDLISATEAVFGVRALAVPLNAGQPLSIFASHLATHRDLVGQVAAELMKWGIEMFVATSTSSPTMSGERR